MGILSLVTVEPILFIYMMVIFLESNGLKSLINTKSCLEIYDIHNCTNQTIATDDTVVMMANSWHGYYEGALFFWTLLVSCHMASWSDCLGRKIIMIIPLVGTIIASVINAILSMFIDVHIAYFFISATVSGLTFGTLGIISSTFAHISDIVTQETRTIRILILEVMIFSGNCLGTYISGFILQDMKLTTFLNSYAVLFILEGVLTFVVLIYTIFRISNANETENTEQISLRQLFSFVHLKVVGKTVFKKREGGRRKVILLLILSLMIIYYGSIVQMTLSFFFTESKLHWSMTEFSKYRSLELGLEGAALIFGLPLAFYLHVNDYLLAAIGVLSRMSGLLIFGLSNVSDMIYCSAVLSMFSEFSVPTIRSMISKLVDDDEKGKIFAFTTIVQNICFFTGGFVFPAIFKASKDFFLGLSFEIVAGLQGIILIIFAYIFWARKIYFFCAKYLCCGVHPVVTVYETMENEDGSITEHCVKSGGDELYNPVA